jgi:PAS domain S-box-containing protein
MDNRSDNEEARGERKINGYNSFARDTFERSILNALTANIAVLNDQGVIIWVNTAWLKFALDNGISSINKVNVGVNYIDICRRSHGKNSEEAPIVLDGLLSILSGDSDYFEIEYPCHSPDVKRWFLLKATPVGSRNNKFIVVSHINITKRKLAEEALKLAHDELDERVNERTLELERANESLNTKIAEQIQTEETVNKSTEMLRLVMDNIPQAVFWKDINSVYLGCNAVFASFAGVGNPVNIIGKTDHDLAWTREEADAFRKDDRRVMDSDMPIYHIIEPQHQADGKIGWLDTNKVPLHDHNGRVAGILGTYEDITERKQVEDALLESEEKFRILSETSTVAIFLHYGDKFIYVNSAAEKLTGYSKEDLLNMHFWGFIAPDHREQVKAMGLSRLAGDKPIPRYEVKIITKQGEYKWIDLSSTVIRYYGKPSILATAMDITQRINTEKELERLKAQAEMYVDFMSHDISNMNQAIMGYMELALDNLDNVDIERTMINDSLQVIGSSSQLIDNVKKLRRLQTGDIHPTMIDIGNVLTEVKSEYARATNRNVTFNYLPVSGYYLKTDAMIKDVLSNLVGNAIKHSSGDLVISLQLNRVQLDHHEYYRIIVEDNGRGIPDEQKKKLFWDLEKGGLTGTRRGIGLQLVKTFVNTINGRVWIEDRVQGDYTKGARFVVMLPALDR